MVDIPKRGGECKRNHFRFTEANSTTSNKEEYLRKRLNFPLRVAGTIGAMIHVITLLRVIPTMTFIHFLTGKSSGILSDISSDILFDILSGISSGI